MASNKLDSVTKITTILTCLSLVTGIVIGMMQIKESLSRANTTLEKANQTLDAIKVEALSNVMDILDIHSKVRIQQVKFDAERFEKTVDDFHLLFSAGKTGEQIYYSPALQEFREIVSHYERLSVLIKLGYVEFQVIFDTIAFPDNFWRDSLALRTRIAENWFGEDKALSDFLSGFAGLCESYKRERLAQGSTRADSMVCE